ncbi:MAG: hypothetical protein LH624_19190, partial [Cryobacterium sp.]|nr:hypothetical protein [Cryobacterium sp.]
MNAAIFRMRRASQITAADSLERTLASVAVMAPTDNGVQAQCLCLSKRHLAGQPPRIRIGPADAISHT